MFLSLLLFSVLVSSFALTFWPRDNQTFSMLNSVEHEILNAHK